MCLKHKVLKNTGDSGEIKNKQLFPLLRIHHISYAHNFISEAHNRHLIGLWKTLENFVLFHLRNRTLERFRRKANTCHLHI